MKSKIALLIGVILCLSSCGKDYTYRIEGKLSNLETQTIYIVFEKENYTLIDTIECAKPGQFVVEQSIEGFNSATLFFENKSRWLTVYLKPGSTVSISGDVQYPMLLQVKGGKINEQLSAVRKLLSPLLKEYTDLNRQLNNKEHNSIEETEIASRIANVNMQLNEQVTSYIKEHSDEEVSVVLIQMFFMEADDTRRMDELLALLDPRLKSFYLVHTLEQFSARAKRTALGAEAPGFTVENIEGTSVNLDSFASKYVLLAFTAPWCDMCQTEDLYLDKVAMKYPKEEVDILLVSLDSNQKEVRRLLETDSIAWNLVTDSAGQATMLLDLYNVSALPRCFLIDEEGKILLKTENGLEIRQTLEKLFEDEEE
ncbi:AhpC/TSA family protein [Parabacteroides sp. 52]|uniref:TlpA disulfide reductase family protein n=1 Tax=unclassified Parabacteroides TaxID=2649774 RepID=UPI0013D33E92|nr:MULTISPECIES: TlpA disulfide reductase family protein [unclassified Parabacteroides]NDV54820.1 AhpC/TSA family protein [Parabacteroides sp. 52]